MSLIEVFGFPYAFIFVTEVQNFVTCLDVMSGNSALLSSTSSQTLNSIAQVMDRLGCLII